MNSTKPTSKNGSTAVEHPNSALGELVGELTIYYDIGLDTDGRAHFHAPESDSVIVTTTDRRGLGIRTSDVERRIPLDGKSVATYVQFVSEEADVSWRELDWH